MRNGCYKPLSQSHVDLSNSIITENLKQPHANTEKPLNETLITAFIKLSRHYLLAVRSAVFTPHSTKRRQPVISRRTVTIELCTNTSARQFHLLLLSHYTNDTISHLHTVLHTKFVCTFWLLTRLYCLLCIVPVVYVIVVCVYACMYVR